MKNSFFQHTACEWQVIILDDQQSNHICIALKQSVTSSFRGVLRLAARLEGADITTSSPSSSRAETGFLNWEWDQQPWDEGDDSFPHLGLLLRANNYNTESLCTLNSLLHVESASKSMAYCSVWVWVWPYSVLHFNLALDCTFPAHFFLNRVLPKRPDCGRDLLSCTVYSSMICKTRNSMACRLQSPNCLPRPNSAYSCCTHPHPLLEKLRKIPVRAKAFCPSGSSSVVEALWGRFLIFFMTLRNSNTFKGGHKLNNNRSLCSWLQAGQGLLP